MGARAATQPRGIKARPAEGTVPAGQRAAPTSDAICASEWRLTLGPANAFVAVPVALSELT